MGWICSLATDQHTMPRCAMPWHGNRRRPLSRVDKSVGNDGSPRKGDEIQGEGGGSGLPVQGAWGEDFSKWFSVKLDFYCLTNCWARRISVVLQRGVVKAQWGRCAKLCNHYRWEEVTKRTQGDEALCHGVKEDQSVANVRRLRISPGDDGADGFRTPDG